MAGVFNNVGSGHALTHGFSVFGYHVTGSTGGVLFLYGIVVGAAAILGLGLLLAGARRTSRRGRAARRELKQSRPQTAAISQDRDLTGQRESAQAETARSETARADSSTASPFTSLRVEAGRAECPTACAPREWPGRHSGRSAAAGVSFGVPQPPIRECRGPMAWLRTEAWNRMLHPPRRLCRCSLMPNSERCLRTHLCTAVHKLA